MSALLRRQMTLDLDNTQSTWFGHMRSEWIEVMRPFSMIEGWSDQIIKRGKSFTPIQVLLPRHIASARIVPSREYLLTLLPNGGVVGEIGTQHGYFAKKIFDIVQPRELHLFDLSFDSFDQAGLTIEESCLHRHVGDSSSMLAQMPDAHFDWLYIDGDHSYIGVSNDLRVAAQKIKSDGFLILNDFTYWSPLEAIDYGVTHAVCDFCVERDWHIICFALEPWMYCDVVIAPIIDNFDVYKFREEIKRLFVQKFR